MSQEFTIGADPEIFLVDKDKKPVSAHGVIPGTKKEPFPVKDGAIQVDGMAVEFNIKPSLLYGESSVRNKESAKEFIDNVSSVMKSLEKAVQKTSPDLGLNIVPVQEFDSEYLKSQPDEAKELGCDPDYNAYTLQQNPRPDGEVPFRTASGHIHIGWGEGIPVDHPDHFQICADFVKTLDFTVGSYMTLIDKDPRRRELYGKAGAFRPKPYGVEYRTPSNVWLAEPIRRKTVFHMARAAVIFQMLGRTPTDYGITHEEVQEAINTGDVTFAAAALASIRVSGYTPPREVSDHIAEVTENALLS